MVTKVVWEPRLDSMRMIPLLLRSSFLVRNLLFKFRISEHRLCAMCVCALCVHHHVRACSDLLAMFILHYNMRNQTVLKYVCHGFASRTLGPNHRHFQWETSLYTRYFPAALHS